MSCSTLFRKRPVQTRIYLMNWFSVLRHFGEKTDARRDLFWVKYNLFFWIYLSQKPRPALLIFYRKILLECTCQAYAYQHKGYHICFLSLKNSASSLLDFRKKITNKLLGKSMTWIFLSWHGKILKINETYLKLKFIFDFMTN